MGEHFMMSNVITALLLLGMRPLRSLVTLAVRQMCTSSLVVSHFGPHLPGCKDRTDIHFGT